MIDPAKDGVDARIRLSRKSKLVSSFVVFVMFIF